mmetsp:Transcript_11164/g.31589  ORF Transcript_11164/g.31589 Transcript_11164/m.31589 type:complete len:340 (+) Transcript_11164:82-1101(+)
MTLSSDVALNNNRSTCKPGLFYVAPGCSGLTSQGNIAHLSQHQFRSVRRHTARKQQEHRILLLQSQLQQAHRALAAWEAWWYWHKEDYKRELLSFKPDCTEKPLDVGFKTTPMLDSCNVSCVAYVNDEGANLVTIKPDFTEESLDICFQTTIDSCNVSSAAQVDDEGANLVSSRPDCTEEPLDFCFQTTSKLDSVPGAAHDDDRNEEANIVSFQPACTEKPLDLLHGNGMAEVTNRHDFYHSDQNESTNYPSFDEDDVSNDSGLTSDDDEEFHTADIGMMIIADMVARSERVNVAQIIRVLEARGIDIAVLGSIFASREFAMLFEVCGDMVMARREPNG